MFSEYPYINFNDLNLSWIINLVKNLKETVDGFGEWKSEHEEQYQELKNFYDAVMRGDFPRSVQRAFYDWMERNALDIIGELSTHVFFGLTDSGYFVAYIPESWDDIIFNTTEYDITIPCFSDYGHLVLSY